MVASAFAAGVTTSLVASGYVLWGLTMRRSLVEVTKAREAHENYENSLYTQDLVERIREQRMHRDDWIVAMAKNTVNKTIVLNVKHGFERLFAVDVRKVASDAKQKLDELSK